MNYVTKKQTIIVGKGAAHEMYRAREVRTDYKEVMIW